MAYDNLDVLLESKTLELKELQDKKVESLSNEIRIRESQLETIREQYNELKSNFKYNLDLLAERDKELGEIETGISRLNERNEVQVAEISDLKIEVSKNRQRVLEETAKNEEVKESFQSKLTEYETQLQIEFTNKEQKLSMELTETARVKQQLELQLSDLQEDSERRRREWERNLEEEINSMTREHSCKISTYEGKLIQSESKIKQLSVEREALRMSVTELEGTISAQDAHISQMERAVESAEWDVNNYISLQVAKIKELEMQSSEQIREAEKKEQILSHRLSVVEGQLVEKEGLVAQLKGSYETERREREDKSSSRSRELEETKIRYKCELAKLNDKILELSDTISELESRLNEKQVHLETEREKCTRHEVNLKLVDQQYQDQIREIRTQTEMKKQDINRYKTEQALAVKREEALRSEAAQELRLMQLRCERVENKAYSSQEQLLKDLTCARDTALADLKRCKTDVMIRDDEIRVLRSQIAIDSDGTSEAGNPLYEQNERLKLVIGQMSEDMEQLAAQNRTLQPQLQEDTLIKEVNVSQYSNTHDTPEPVLEGENVSLREEVMMLRKTITGLKNKELGEDIGKEELTRSRERLLQMERERDRLLELSNHLRAQLNDRQEQKEVPLRDITHRLTSARSLLNSNPGAEAARKRSTSTQSNISLLHMSGDTSLNEELSDICRMVEQEENRPLSAAGKQLAPITRPSNLTAPKPVFRGPARKSAGPSKIKPKLRNYNMK